ncbi:Nectin-4 Nectin cell adhesion molecule 4 [Channa argus]|uniref:Nectin-4 Nectin cell adhesion molecule 4 n=1 Tax=Channa argus TaxID=215402 RepID=A0A6G1QTI3_CHAAH|nr:Nectin-4 Nectin cell adhesion molecule 4 [Channa argus]KAK2881968.1 hypothetical protein Q8A73_022478 [Channa argus]
MSLGSLNMAGSALGTTFCLLLLAAITQGYVDDEESNFKTMEAVVGQSTTLPCILKNRSFVKLVSVEWEKENREDRGTKLAVLSPSFGKHLFTTHVSLINETRDEGNGFHLHFPLVKKNDSGIYICNIATFPLGSLRRVIELKVKDIDKIVCDVEGTVEVHSGENVIIRCQVLPNAHYNWTKDKMLVSEKESLELWQVTDVHAGVYTLTVNTGNNILQREFNINVLTVTTSQTDLVKVSPQSNVTREGLTDSADSSFTTSPPTGLLATDTSVTWTVRTSPDVTDGFSSPNNVTVTAGDYISSFTNDTDLSVPSSPATHPDPYHVPNSTALSYDSTVFSPTWNFSSDDTRDKSTPYAVHPNDDFSVTPEEFSTTGNLTETYGNLLKKKDPNNPRDVEDNAKSHLWALIIIPVVALIVLGSIVYRRYVIKQRMDLPPPFKPPPPPVKYVAVGQSEISAKSYPVSRCESVTYLY